MIKKKKIRFIVIISSIFALLIGIVMSFLIYMRGNEYSKIAWNSLSKHQRKNVIGGGILSHADIIKYKKSYIIPDDPVYKIDKDIVNDEFYIKFKEGVPYAIVRMKIALMDGTILANKDYLGFYLVKIKGIDTKRLFKLMDKLEDNDFVVETTVTSDTNFGPYDLSDVPSEDIKDKETGVVSFYYFKGIKLYKYIVYIVNDTKKTYVIDTQEILAHKKPNWRDISLWKKIKK